MRQFAIEVIRGDETPCRDLVGVLRNAIGTVADVNPAELALPADVEILVAHLVQGHGIDAKSQRDVRARRQLVDKLDGSISIEALWELSLEFHAANAPTQGEFIQLLAQLHEAELLIVNRKLNPELLFQGPYFGSAGGRTFDVSPDGERFLMIKILQDSASAPQIIIVENWFTELERLAPTME